MAWRDNEVDEFEEDALQQVLSLERRIQALLRDAQSDAQGIVADAQARAAALREQAERALQDEVAELTRRAERETEERRRVLQEHAEREVAAWARVAESHLDEALEFVLDVVTLRGAD